MAITGESSVGSGLSEFYNNDSDAKGGAVYISQVPAVVGVNARWDRGERQHLRVGDDPR